MPPEPPTIRVANAAQQRTALELVLRPLAPESRGPLLDAIGTAGPQSLGPLDALFIAESGGEVVAAVWAQPAPGRAAALWPPEWIAERPEGWAATELALVRATTAACDAAGVAMTQALFEIAGDSRTGALETAGFYKMAELRYLGRSVPSPAEPIAQAEFNFSTFSPTDHARLKRLLTLTYTDSLDCPGLDDLRDLEDVLIGYRSTGRYDPAHWLIVDDGEKDVGVLLMAEHPDAEQAELIYMGVTPEARGRGLGKLLIQQALATAAEMGVDHLMVAVDRENKPARRLYEGAGFAAWARRHVYVRARNAKPPRK